jgi:dipeptidyl aminopeptidase/acylaminoacyl peptidase
MHPLMIEAMRQREYPGSEIVFEQTLLPAATYDQFVVSYQSEGNKINALMTIPRGERPAAGWPVIVFNHGYIPPNVYRTTERYVAYVEAFAQHGYIVFKSDYRGHGSSEGSAVGAYGSPAYTTDVLNAVASVKQYPDADPNRIGMWGHSMGGQITLRAMVITGDIKAGVIWGGVVASYPDLLKYWFRGPQAGTPTSTPNPNTTRGSWRRSMVEVYGYPEDNPEFWAAISPNSYLDEISGPVQLHHSIEDESVPVILSELLYGELRDAGVVAQYWTYENDNHNISNHFTEAMQHSIQWFDAFVKGEQ